MNNNENELYHYGVLGMKWGRRKARKYEKLVRKNSGRRGDANVRAEAQARLTKQNAKNASYERGLKAQRSVYKSRSMGAKIATNILGGPFANRTYAATMVATNGNKWAARGATAVGTLLGGGTGLGHLAVAGLITNAYETQKAL